MIFNECERKVGMDGWMDVNEGRKKGRNVTKG
jgi:hypothetical protein